jgi:hypothetical protein
MPAPTSASIAPRRRAPRGPSHPRPGRPARRATGPRRIDAPQDSALYTCHCGAAWRGAVVTSVRCPDCGVAQAW